MRNHLFQLILAKMKNELLKKSLETIEKLAAQLSAVKDMFPLDHPVQNQAAYDVEEICNELARAALAKARDMKGGE